LSTSGGDKVAGALAELLRVSVSVDLPPWAMVAGLKALPSVGGTAHVATDTTFESSVTAPFCARALPARVALVVRPRHQRQSDEIGWYAKRRIAGLTRQGVIGGCIGILSQRRYRVRSMNDAAEGTLWLLQVFLSEPFTLCYPGNLEAQAACAPTTASRLLPPNLKNGAATASRIA